MKLKDFIKQLQEYDPNLYVNFYDLNSGDYLELNCLDLMNEYNLDINIESPVNTKEKKEFIKIYHEE